MVNHLNMVSTNSKVVMDSRADTGSKVVMDSKVVMGNREGMVDHPQANTTRLLLRGSTNTAEAHTALTHRNLNSKVAMVAVPDMDSKLDMAGLYTSSLDINSQASTVDLPALLTVCRHRASTSTVVLTSTPLHHNTSRATANTAGLPSTVALRSRGGNKWSLQVYL